jgi:hypothetical protein
MFYRRAGGPEKKTELEGSQSPTSRSRYPIELVEIVNSQYIIGSRLTISKRQVFVNLKDSPRYPICRGKSSFITRV